MLKNVFVSNETTSAIQNDDATKKFNNLKRKNSKLDESDSDDEKLNMLKEAAIDINFLAKTTCIKQHKKDFLSPI